MSAGMADIIAAHVPTITSSTFNSPESGNGRTCRCGMRVEVLHSEMDDNDSDAQPYLDRKLAAHVAEELAKAGYGNLQEALVAAADAMPIETLEGADKASVWLRQRAHANDPEGRALVQAIHDRKAQA